MGKFVDSIVATTLVAALLMGLSGVSGCRSSQGMTPLLLAAHSGDEVELESLVADGEVIDQTSSYGWTALMFASWKGHLNQVAFLLDHGADPNHVSGPVASGFETVAGHPPSTALREAVRSGQVEIAKLLLDHSAILDPQSLALAGQNGEVDMLEFLDSHNPDWSEPSGSAFYPSPLIAAASLGRDEAVSWLLAQGVDPDQKIGERTALGEACAHSRAGAVDRLLEAGADPNLVNGDIVVESPLVLAVSPPEHGERTVRTVELLLAAGADPAWQRQLLGESKTALDLAQESLAHMEGSLRKAEREWQFKQYGETVKTYGRIVALLAE